MSVLTINGGRPVGKLNIPKWPIYNDEEVNIAVDTVKSGVWGRKGSRQEELERNFAEFCGCKYAVSCANGTVAIKIALEALGIGPYDEVIVPGLTWMATALAVLEVNAIPILVDIDPETYTLDPAKVEAAITKNTKAIIVVHLYGRVANMSELVSITKKHNLKLIEDCSHQHGSEWEGKKVGTIGDIGTFSLQSSKIFTCGEGGLVTTNSEILFEYLQSLKNVSKQYSENAVFMQGSNYRLGEFQSAIAVTQLSRLKEQNKIREENADYIDNALKNQNGVKTLYKDPRITSQAYYMYTLKYNTEYWGGISKDVFIKALNAELDNSNIVITGVYEPLNASPSYIPRTKKSFNISPDYWERINPERFSLPNCEKAFHEEAITFLHPMLLINREECDLFIEAIYKIFNNKDELYSVAHE